MKWLAEKTLQRLIEDVDEKPPVNARAGDDAALKNEKPRPVAGTSNLPVTVPFARTRNMRRLRFSIGLVAILLAAGGAGFYWWKHSQAQLPVGISYGNGRLEADEIDIDTKFPGRIAELRADIGDMVSAGQVVARMDTRDLQESLKKAQAQVQQAQRAIEEANANLEQQRTQQTLAAQELERTAGLAEERLCDQGTVRSAQAGARRRQCRIERRQRNGSHKPNARSKHPSTMSGSTRSTSATTIWWRRATAGFNIASPISARCFRPAARSSPCWTSRMSTWTFICRPRKPARSRSAPMRRIVLDAYPEHADSGEGLLHRQPGAVHAEDGRDPERARQADVPDPGADRS